MYGPNENTAHRRIELIFMPNQCDKRVENCTDVMPLEAIKKEFGVPNFIMIKNRQRLDTEQYDENSIVNESLIYNM